jgi:DNA invertase Pin-like site-specific DNA recombinase
MFSIVAAMAQLERRVIQERVMAGIEHAKARGTKSGAAIGRPRAVFDRVQVKIIEQTITGCTVPGTEPPSASLRPVLQG